MPTNFLWGAVGSTITLLTTEMNSLADLAGTALGPTIDNTPNRWQVGRIELLLASNSLAFTASSYVKVFLLPLHSDSSYPNYTSGATPLLAEDNYLVGIIKIWPGTVSAAVLRDSTLDAPIPAGTYQTVLINRTGVTLPASGNTLKLIPTPSQY